jgi:hypothetical protein
LFDFLMSTNERDYQFASAIGIDILFDWLIY